MLKIPYGVTICLYNGVMDKIEWVKKQIEWAIKDRKIDMYVMLERDYKDIIEAINFYNEHCVLSGKYLTEALAELTPIYDDYRNISK